MAKRRRSGSLGDWFWSLPWLLKVLCAIFLDCILGAIRLIDGLAQCNIIKIVIGILWLFYGLGIGWLIDIVCTVLNIRPLLL